ncbi:hypothetical protein [Micromonospora sp. CB01531]|uniref:hypothetical protein n=1 Tax=Micromonospora sp. CB01531 TaxID=1718947 RepID=UPI00093C9D43|nr:hypothetical protein [Micromonospora sp. CB01531]OKI75055.1 hypothetical protein A6A27_17585 [Micromonospora sp. CB01531]
MTRAPNNLLAVRNLLLTHLNVDKKAVRPEDLEPGEVGIVGDANHRGGYHCGSDRVVKNDYSVVESTRDSSGLTLDASALDVGMFTVRSGGRTHNLRTFSAWCVAQCVANESDARDLREIIYSPDGKVVKRWDRLRKRTTGDSSHLTHTHFSFFRDSTKAGRDQTPLFRRYLTGIGLLEDPMAQFTDAHAAVLNQLAAVLPTLVSQSGYTDGRMEAIANGRTKIRSDLKGAGGPVWLVDQVNGIRADLATVAGRPPVDVPALAAALAPLLLAQLTPEAIAAALSPEIARQVADELSRRLAA